MGSTDGKTPLDQRDSVNGWLVSLTRGSSADFHNNAPPPDTGPQVWVHTPDRPALVLGSAQPRELVREDVAEADGIEVCRRRSGGGLVFLNPETDCWLDLIVPSDSTLWDNDVGRAFHWVGRRWAEVLAAPPLGLTPVIIDRPLRTPAGRIWCYADLGHGEVTVDGKKVVGLSQRRTRTWLRIQSLVLGAWPGETLRRYVDIEAAVSRHPDRFRDQLLDMAALDPGLIAAGFPADGPRPIPFDLANRFLDGIPAPF